MTDGNTSIAGYVDIYAASSTAGGWIIAGWITRGWDRQGEAGIATLEFGTHTFIGPVCACVFERSDVQKVGVGLIMLVQGGDLRPAYLTDVLLTYGSDVFRLVAAQTAQALTESQILDRGRDLISAAPRSEQRADLLQRFSRSRFDGHDTLSKLPLPVFLELDAIYLCPPHGMLLRGWFADPFHTVAKIRLRGEQFTHVLDPAQWIPIPRPDVVRSLTETVGGVDRAPGFLAYASPIADTAGTLYFEVETLSGALAFKRVTAPLRTGLVAMREILGAFDLRHDELKRGFDGVAGPAIASLNRQRLRGKPRILSLAYGEPPVSPRATLIVPLYGRIDFVEYQLGLFHHTLAPDHELIYVLDDPDKQREMESLAAACHAKFGRSFTVLCLSCNVGYAPANNIGLSHARAPFVCFLNSDVFPRTPDWLEQMLRSAAEKQVGAVGALLVFEDGTVQHEGVAYSRLEEFAGWAFALHPNKGCQPTALEGTEEVDAVTGACLLMRTDLARELGGFDEGYAIGDFEDVDLCKQVQTRGLRCVLNRRAQLYHLERQSQGDQHLVWRTNLTLFNAWRFDRKWGAAA